MQARRLIDNASFGPDTLKAIGQAFDETWASIEGTVACDQQREAIRLKLATALLSVASEDSRDVEVLKKAALEVMARDYRWQRMLHPTKQYGTLAPRSRLPTISPRQSLSPSLSCRADLSGRRHCS